MSEEVQNKLTNYIDQAIKIRFEFNNIEFAAEAVELHQALVEVQKSLTALEDYLSKSMRAKALMDRKLSGEKMKFQEAWDRSIIKTVNRPTLSEYATGKERAAEANLDTLMHAMNLRRLEEWKSFADEAVDIIKLHYYGLDKIRQDLRKRLDLAQADSYS